MKCTLVKQMQNWPQGRLEWNKRTILISVSHAKYLPIFKKKFPNMITPNKTMDDQNIMSLK